MIRKLESGERRLTDVWMSRIAEALKCTPADLIANALSAAMRDEVEPVDIDPQVAEALGARNMKAYRVQGDSMMLAGIEPGQTIIIDETPLSWAELNTHDVVLIQIADPRVRVLRAVYKTNTVPLLLTAQEGANITITSSDRSMKPLIIGRVVRK